MGGSPPAPSQPAPRDVGKETRDSLQAQVDLAPQIYESEKEYKPKYADLDTATLERTLKGTDEQRGLLDLYKDDIYPFAREQAAADQALQQSLQTTQRTADITDIELLGGRARDAFRGANPIIAELSDQALTDVKLRGRLSPEELRDVEQTTRAEFSERGMVRSNPAVVSEFLNRDTVSRGKMFQDRDFALRLAGMEQDPWLAVLGRPGSQVNTTGAAQGTFGSAGYSLGSQNTMFGMNQAQTAQYNSQLNSDNFEQANNFAIMKANAKGAGKAGTMGLIGAGIGAVGAVAAAF